jgi:hypothetical protein
MEPPVHRRRSPAHDLLCRAALAAALLTLGFGVIPAHAVPPTNLIVDGTPALQRIAGAGVSVNVNSWNGGALRPALDLLARPAHFGGAGMTTFRVVRDPMMWVTSSSDITLLHALDPPTLTRIYEAPAMRDLWSTIAYLDSIGVPGDHIILNFMGWTPTFLDGGGAYGQPSYLRSGKEPALATMIASLVYYGRVVRGLDFKLLAPLNELDYNCLEGPCVPADQYVVFLDALIAELNFMGQTDIRIVGPDVAGQTGVYDYLDPMMSDPTIPGRVDHFALHNYGSAAKSTTPYTGHDYWLTETADHCDSCDIGGTPPQGEWAFATQTADILLGSLANNFTLAAYYDGYDSFYYHHNHYGYWGLLAYDTTTATYTPRKRFYVVAQVTGFIEPGTRRINVTDTLSGLGVTQAFFDSTTGRLDIVGRNTTSLPILISGQLRDLPAIGHMTCTLTDSSLMNLTSGPEVVVLGGLFTVTIPPQAVFSLEGEDPLLEGVGPQVPGGPTAWVSDARPNPTRGGAEFALTLPGPADVAWEVLDVQGRRVWRAASQRYETGRWTLAWDGRTGSGPAPAGVYLARIRAGAHVFSRSIAIVR